MSVQDDLQEAFAGESQANRRYLAFSKEADEEGYSQVARIFREAALAETVHAHNHLRVMGGIHDTKENLEEAIGGETFEFTKMYPGMIERAREEGNSGATRSFNYANQVEEIHAELYKKALTNLGENEVADYYVCPVCGNTVEGEFSGECPICGTPGSKFIKAE